VKKDDLQVVWGEGNKFELNFNLENTTYDLSSFTITLNASSLFNDSAGESKLIIS
jgi:hypothetical protein